MAEPQAEPGNDPINQAPAGDTSRVTGDLAASVWIELAWVEGGRGQSLRLSPTEAHLFIGRSYQYLLDDERVRLLLQRLGWREYRWAVYGRRRDPSEAIVVMDRIELCPPLQVDPMTARNRRVAHRRRQAERSRWLPDRRNPTRSAD